MARTVKQIDSDVGNLSKGVTDIRASAKKYEDSLKKLETSTGGLERDYNTALQTIRAKAQKEEADAKKDFQTKMRAVATQSTKEMIQIQADSKLVRMAAENLGKLIGELKSATGDQKQKDVTDGRAQEVRRSYATLSAELGQLEAMVRKVEAACK
jgi:chromosome segregation ATPase